MRLYERQMGAFEMSQKYLFNVVGQTIEWRGMEMDSQETDKSIWVFTFPDGYRPSREEVESLKSHISELNIPKPVLVWSHPLSIERMTHQEAIALRDTLNRYLDGEIHE